MTRENDKRKVEAANSFLYNVLMCSFLPTKNNLRRKEISREVRCKLKDIIQRREKAMKLGEAPSDDLLGLLIESNKKYSEEHESALTMDDIIEECKLFYFAGQETTSILLTWTMVTLGMHPEWQSRAREEVLQNFGKNKPDFDGLGHLKIVSISTSKFKLSQSEFTVAMFGGWYHLLLPIVLHFMTHRCR